jgi:phenylalanyl-tRNA synthetase beta chain
MKLSLSWVFDHIVADSAKVDINALVASFNKKVAEIEGVIPVNTAVEKLFLVNVDSINDSTIMVSCHELGTSFSLPVRTDGMVGAWYLVMMHPKGYGWATLQDIGGEQEGLMPALQYEETFKTGAWKKQFAAHDHIIIVDNKSITHRPDMWGHRGFAREIAAFLGYELKPMSALLHALPIHAVSDEQTIDTQTNIRITAPNHPGIKRFAAASFTQLHNQASQLCMAVRLARVGAKPIDALVDATNYVMFDLSQPLHAFDAASIATKKLQPSCAQRGQRLTLLDGQEVELTNEDLVITDGTAPIALAGVMGGLTTAVKNTTTAIVLEAALFDATTIRKTAARFKKRTEASARFEKSLDPAQNSIAIERFARILDGMNITYIAGDIYSFGTLPDATVLEVSHAYIEQELGTAIPVDRVVSILRALDCDVDVQSLECETIYTIKVPSWRATKDIRIPRDIVEEIARLYGYDVIPLQLPRKLTTVSDLHGLYQIRAIKHLLAFGQEMKEVYNYALYDHTFLQQLRWQPQQAIALQNPVSEHWQYMVTSLVPHLIKNVVQHHETHNQLRFFEYARIWPHTDQERSELAGIWYSKQSEISFYELKDSVLQLCAMLELSVTFVRLDAPQDPWFTPYQSASIMHNNQCIGTLGLINKSFIHHVLPQQSSGALFTLDGDFLRTYRAPQKRFTSLVKFPAVERDISMMVPCSATVDGVIAAVQQRVPGIKRIYLVDTFYKPEWQDKKSLTIRCLFQDEHKTLTGQEVDALCAQAVHALNALGAEVR